MKIRGLLSLLATTVFLYATGAQATYNEFSGRAVAAQVKALGLVNITAADTGALPKMGGSKEKNLDLLDIPGIISADLLHTQTSGAGRQARSSAELANLAITVAGVLNVSASVINAKTFAQCNNRVASVGGSSEIVNLAINGTPVVVTGAPNQQLVYTNLPGVLKVAVVINERKRTQSATNKAGVKVNAIHITAVGLLGQVLADVAISSAQSGILCRI